ncbi:MAG: hypothetical protein OEY59_06890 [Deltaproteobacteria bacterium]|nr:hypothetical protein [Deltaproteobacteria bacterium]
MNKTNLLKKRVTGYIISVTAGLLLITGLSGKAHAEFKPGFKVATYFGQFTPSTPSENAHFESTHEANLKLKGSEGDISGYFEIEARNAAHNKGSDFKNTQRRLDYKTGSFKISVGTIVPKEANGYSAKGGTKTSQTKSIGAFEGLLAKTEADGLRVQYEIGEDLLAGLSLYSVDALNGNTEGSANQLGFMGKFGPIGLKISIANGESNDHTGTGPTLRSGNNNLSLLYKSDLFKASLDLTTKKETTPKTDILPETSTETADKALQISIGIGETKALITYALRDIKDESSENWLNLVCDFPINKKTGIQVVYLSKTQTPKIGDALSENFIGTGFYGSF